MAAWSFKGLQEFFVCPDAERNKVPVANIPLNYDYYVRTIYRDDIYFQAFIAYTAIIH